MHVYVNLDIHVLRPDTTPFKINKLFQTMFKLIEIELILRLVNILCKLVQINDQILLYWGHASDLSNIQNYSNFT